LQIGEDQPELVEGDAIYLNPEFRTDTAKWDRAGPPRWLW